MFVGQSQVLGAKEHWKVRALNKCCFFFLQLLHARNSTSERVWRHGLRDDAICALCDQEAETMDHLIGASPYAR
jgi:hypothetical protein